MSASETNSDCTTGRESSLGSSREELEEIALALGLTSAGLLSQEKFRVDRRKLEILIFGNAPETASQYFEDIMHETRTHIRWPSKLKLGAKSKKDPHVRVVGRAEDVKVARERIVSSLSAKENRVNMKIDVSYTEHSHIIGRGGLTIKRVMEDTKCHIHFPDSNRNNPNEKSNQVSISGEVWDVERAREKVRELTPLVFSFDLPVLVALSPIPDTSASYIETLQKTYNVQVMFRTRQKLNSTLVVVKGCEWEVHSVKEATQLLISHMCKNLSDQVSVNMMIEISTHHHSIVLGKNKENLKLIMQNTSTQIIFPDPSDPNIPQLKKSNVIITGNIHDVYRARQQLIGSLPVLLMFDVPEYPKLNSQEVRDLMNDLGVQITGRHKPKQHVLSLVIKGIERHVSNVYEARRRLIAPDDPPIQAEIPSTYYIPNAGPLFGTTWNPIVYPDLPPSPVLCDHMVTPSHGEILWPSMPSLPHLVMGAQHVPVQPMLAQPFHHGYHHNYHHHHHHHHQRQQPYPLGQFSYSSFSLPELPVHSSSNPSSVSSQCPTPRTVSPVHGPPHRNDGVSHTNNDQGDQSGGLKRQLLTPSNYQRQKLHAYKAMDKTLNPHEVRLPNSAWSGYGFSLSSPSSILRERDSNDDKRVVQDWSGPTGLDNESSTTPTCGNCINDVVPASNYLEGLSGSTFSSLDSLNTTDMSSLLASVGADKYAHLFKMNDIDIATFRTMKENDLKEIGVSSFGPRRKMMMAITELNNRDRTPLKRRAAPGAERNASTKSLKASWSYSGW